MLHALQLCKLDLCKLDLSPIRKDLKVKVIICREDRKKTVQNIYHLFIPKWHCFVNDCLIYQRQTAFPILKCAKFSVKTYSFGARHANTETLENKKRGHTLKLLNGFELVSLSDKRTEDSFPSFVIKITHFFFLLLSSKRPKIVNNLSATTTRKIIKKRC